MFPTVVEPYVMLVLQRLFFGGKSICVGITILEYEVGVRFIPIVVGLENALAWRL